jgi:tRNA (guanine-N7-)-methyltransferase
MPRRKVLRYLKTELPAPQAEQKYTLHYSSHDLYQHPYHFPKIRSESLFDNEQPLELEIGCGCGEYLCHLAQQHPETNFVGLDKSLKALYQGVLIADELSLANIKFIEADFHLLYPLLVPEALQEVYLHFPDPYYKPQVRARRRIFNTRFLDHMYESLIPGGYISVASDHEEVFMEMLEMAEQDQRFQKAHKERYLEGGDIIEVKSRFQRIWEGHAVVPRRFLLQKIAADYPST